MRRFTLSFLIGLCLPVATVTAEDNPIFEQLTTQGVPFAEGITHKLPAPTMPDGLDQAGQQKILDAVADPSHPLSQLMRKSPVSPFILKIDKLSPAPPQATVRTVDLWFIAHGPLEAIYTKQFLEDFFKLAAADSTEEIPVEGGTLDEAQLKERNLIGPDGPREGEYWFHGSFGMFDRVALSATRHATANKTLDSILLGSMLDPRFLNDPKFPNQWRSATRNQLGKLDLGPPQPYSGAAFYTKVTRLIEPDGALFIEYHHVFTEPAGWFDGANLLRSKLPLVAQDRVRKFRRRLAASATATAPAP
jgi:hypothetical protein